MSIYPYIYHTDEGSYKNISIIHSVRICGHREIFVPEKGYTKGMWVSTVVFFEGSDKLKSVRYSDKTHVHNIYVYILISDIYRYMRIYSYMSVEIWPKFRFST